MFYQCFINAFCFSAFYDHDLIKTSARQGSEQAKWWNMWPWLGVAAFPRKLSVRFRSHLSCSVRVCQEASTPKVRVKHPKQLCLGKISVTYSKLHTLTDPHMNTDSMMLTSSIAVRASCELTTLPLDQLNHSSLLAAMQRWANLDSRFKRCVTVSKNNWLQSPNV